MSDEEAMWGELPPALDSGGCECLHAKGLLSSVLATPAMRVTLCRSKKWTCLLPHRLLPVFGCPAGIRSVAVVLKHAAIYPAHEQLVGQLARDMGFTQVSLGLPPVCDTAGQWSHHVVVVGGWENGLAQASRLCHWLPRAAGAAITH